MVIGQIRSAIRIECASDKRNLSLRKLSNIKAPI